VENEGCRIGFPEADLVKKAVLDYMNKENYEAPVIADVKWRILKKKIDTSEVVWDYNEVAGFVFDNKLKAVSLIGVPEDVEVVYTDNVKAGAGTYVARAKLVYDTRNC
jgi:hypothetical protein